MLDRVGGLLEVKRRCPDVDVPLVSLLLQANKGKHVILSAELSSETSLIGRLLWVKNGRQPHIKESSE